VPEVLWTSAGEVVEVPTSTDAEVLAVLQWVLRQAAKHWPDDVTTWAEDEYEVMQHEAVQSRLGLHDAPTPVAQRKRLVAVAHGFSLHAGTAVHGNDRAGLERLTRYGARGPVAQCRLTRTNDGRYQYTPKKGLTFTVSAEALVRRLVALAISRRQDHHQRGEGASTNRHRRRCRLHSTPGDLPSMRATQSQTSQGERPESDQYPS
jgi:hypothetical protein